ncbi:MAG: hypothetical protein HC804_13270 [Anaerolineae bacterium]|nr:hypothetical protein [Anaerolineae bacterium]
MRSRHRHGQDPDPSVTTSSTPFYVLDRSGHKVDDLLHWADCNGLYTGDNLLLGVGHDDPGITPPDKVRFDMCLTVPEPFLPDGEIGYQELPGGHYATASYIGPFGPPIGARICGLFSGNWCR